MAVISTMSAISHFNAVHIRTSVSVETFSSLFNLVRVPLLISDISSKSTLGIERPYVFLFKEDFGSACLELSYGGQAIHRVSRKTADRLRNDQIDFSG